MNNADLIVATWSRAGIRHGYGIPSGNVLPLIEAMRTGGVEFVLTAHEGTAAFAADVTGRMTGRPGLCIATLGPGATNLSTGVGSAFLDRSPMLAVTCNLNTDQLGRRIQMYIDHHALFSPITKASLALRHGNVAETIAEAISLALSEPMGPVHLDLPEDVALAPAEGDVPEIVEGSRSALASDAAITEANRLLGEAKRPVVVIGSTAMRLDNFRSLCQFVERNSLPFATTTMAKGLIDENHTLSLGCIERGRRQVQRRFLQTADLIIGLGYDTIEVEYESWIGSVPVLNIDIDRADVDETVRVVHEVTGELTASLDRLNALPATSNDWPADTVSDHRRIYQASLRPASETFCPHQAIDVIRAVLPPDGVLAFDVGAHTHQVSGQWAATGPRRFLITNGWSSMGFGLPAAIAAKLARPDLPVVCLLGDGCFQMTCGEVATAKRAGLALPIVVLDDTLLGLIVIKQEQRQFGVYGTELGNNLPKPPTHYFGVPATLARSTDELDVALREALVADGPTVIHAAVDPAHYFETVFD